MNTDILTGAAIFGTIVLFALRELFAWLGKKNLQNTDANIAATNLTLKGLSEQIVKADIKQDMILQINRTMYDWHDKSDEDGVKIWYVRRSLEEALQDNVRAINILAKNSEIQTRILEDMHKSNKETSKENINISRLLERLLDK